MIRHHHILTRHATPWNPIAVNLAISMASRILIAFAAAWHFPPDVLCAMYFHHSLEATLQATHPEFFKLFPVALAALLPDQLHQSPTGFQTLIKVAKHCRAFDLTDVCKCVDAAQMKMAEGCEISNHLSQLLVQTQRTMGLSEN